jgi:hypothetical protein
MSYGDIVGTVAAVAAVVAAVVGIQVSRSANARRRRDVRPRVTMNIDDSALGSPWGRVILSNAGGAVIQGYVLARRAGEMVGGPFTLAEHTAGYAFHLGHLGEAKGGPTQIMAAIGEDVDGKWWDLLASESTSPPPHPFDSEQFRAWFLAPFEHVRFYPPEEGDHT